MKIRTATFSKSAISTAVAIAMSSTAYAEVDAWSYSGMNARGTALQSSYTNLDDAYNIWVNPGLVSKYSNRVDVNAAEDGDAETGASGDTSETGAGVFMDMAGQTFGAYIGRPSDSLLGNASSVGSFASIQDITSFGVTGMATPPTDDVNTPENQFDLFWGMKLPGVGDIGARVNFQAVSDEFTGPTNSETTPNAISGTYTGLRNTSIVSNNKTETASNELNLAFGIVDAASVWDATLLVGFPTGESKAAFSDSSVDDTFVAGAITNRDTETFSGTQKVADDGAINIGIAGRLHNIMIPDSIITLKFQQQDSSYKSTTQGTFRTVSDAVPLGTVDPGDTDTSIIFSEAGKRTYEQNVWSVHFTKNFIPTPGNLLIATIGMVNEDGTGHTKNTVTAFREVNNLTGVVIDHNPDPGGPYLGTQTNTKFELESFSIPLVVGFEGAFTANTTVRAALSKDLYNSLELTTTTQNWELPATDPAPTGTTATQQINVSTEKEKETHLWNTPTTLSLGAGYKDGGLTVDAVVEKEFVTLGTDNGLVSRINVTWLIP